MATKPETAEKSKVMTKIYSQASNDFVIATYKKREKDVQGSHDIESAISSSRAEPTLLLARQTSFSETQNGR